VVIFVLVSLVFVLFVVPALVLVRPAYAYSMLVVADS
jgi:hypothetical protein